MQVPPFRQGLGLHDMSLMGVLIGAVDVVVVVDVAVSPAGVVVVLDNTQLPRKHCPALPESSVQLVPFADSGPVKQKLSKHIP